MARFINRPFILAVLAIVAATTLGAFALPFVLPPLRSAEFAAGDLRAALIRRPEPQNQRVVVVAITEETLARYPYRTPVDRGLLADLLQNLTAATPKAIGLYLPFIDPTEPAKDARLRNVLRRVRVPLVLAAPADPALLDTRQRDFRAAFTDGLRSGSSAFGTGGWNGTARWIAPGDAAQSGFAAALSAELGVTVPRRPIRLTYHGAPNEHTPPFLTIPAHAAVSLPLKWFFDKVVLIGLDTPLTDRHRVPAGVPTAETDEMLSGVHLQAHAVAQLLAGQRAPSGNPTIALLTLFAMSVLGAAAALPRCRPAIRVAVIAGGPIVFVGLMFAAAYSVRAPIPIVAPVLGYGAAYLLTRIAIGRFAQSRRDYLRTQFASRTSPKLLQAIEEDAPTVELGGEDRAVSLMVTNLTDFTKIAEGLSANDIVAVMNGYLEGICSTVARHDGVVDRVDVETVVSIFGAPLDQPDHASRAIHCALAIDDFAESYRERQITSAGKLAPTCVGVHTGRAVVGNFGGASVFSYSAYGDTVRTAARLEAANHALGTRLCASAETARAADDVIFRPIGTLRWRNENNSVDAFEPLTESKSETPEIQAYVRAFRLVQCEDETASAEVARAVQIAPHDPLPKLYQHRLARGYTGTTILLDDETGSRPAQAGRTVTNPSRTPDSLAPKRRRA